MMDVWEIQRRFRRRLRWARVAVAAGIVVLTGIFWFGVFYAVSAIARGDVW